MFSSYRKIFRFLKPYWLYILGSLIGVLVVSAIVVSIPKFLGSLVNNIIVQKDLLRLNTFALIGIGIIILKEFFTYGYMYLMAFAAQGAITDLRNHLFGHLQKLPFVFHVKWHTGEIISRTINDITVVQETIRNFADHLYQFLILCGMLTWIFLLNWRLALITLLIIPVVTLVITRFGHQIRKITTFRQEKMADISTILQETISGIKEVKSFCREDYEIERFGKENKKNFWLSMKRAQISATQEPVVEFLAIVGILGVVWFGAREFINGHLTLQEITPFCTAVFLLVDPVRILSRVYGMWQQGLAAGERVFEIMSISSEIKESSEAKELPLISGSVNFENVSFSYENDTFVLQNLNLEVKPGEVVALVGPSGVGKTTFLNLVPRFYDPTSGKITIDGYDLKEIKINSLRAQIGIVPQETVLFSGTIRSNITYGKLDASEEQIVAAAKGANAHNFILQLPQRYDTEVGERGVKLSGGEKQRIAMARVILKNPRIILLDEATSALDTASEILVQEAMKHLMKGRTTFIIAHRLSTIRNAQRIIVFDKGKIVEEGNHKALLDKKGLYNELYHAQFKETS